MRQTIHSIHIDDAVCVLPKRIRFSVKYDIDGLKVKKLINNCSEVSGPRDAASAPEVAYQIAPSAGDVFG
jgi:hypothetical protein